MQPKHSGNQEDRIRKQITRALSDYQMIRSGDRIMVGVSGGKDSTILLILLHEIQRRSKIAFSVQGVLLDQKQPGFDPEKYQIWLRTKGLELEIIQEDTYSIVQEKTPPQKSFCGLCSRLRRGILYNHAYTHGYTKIALGHHRDDMNETLLLNLFYTGRLAAMPPLLRADDGRNTVIRPLAYVAEKHLNDLAEHWDIPVIPCNLCGSQENLRRQKMKALIKNMEQDIPDIQSSMQTAMKNLRPSQLLDSHYLPLDQVVPRGSQQHRQQIPLEKA